MALFWISVRIHMNKSYPVYLIAKGNLPHSPNAIASFTDELIPRKVLQNLVRICSTHFWKICDSKHSIVISEILKSRDVND